MAGGMHGRGHACWGACMMGVCVAGGMCMAGGHAWCMYIRIFPVYLRMALIFTNFPTGSGFQPCALLEICEYQRHPSVNWKNSNVDWLSLI